MTTGSRRDTRSSTRRGFRRSTATAPTPVLIRIQKRAGHGGGMPTSMRIALEADRWAFLFHHLGMN